MDEYSLISLSSIIEDGFNNKSNQNMEENNNMFQDETIYRQNDETSHKKKMFRSKVYCSNCGKYGHLYKKCLEPITSIGIINLYLMDLKLDVFFMNKYVIKHIIQKYKQNNYNIKNILLHKFNEKNNVSLIKDTDIEPYVERVKNKLKLLMIRRKNTVGYIEFVRGRYNELNNDSILFLLNQMTHEEINYLKSNTFEDIWNKLWNGKFIEISKNEVLHNSITSNVNTDNLDSHEINIINETNESNKISSKDKHIYVKVHMKEYISSNEKFSYILQNNIFDLLEPKLHILYEQPEWGFPKGRRNIHEKNIDCAVREFEEETGINGSNIEIMDRIYPLNETLIGTNNLNYKHLYYLSIGKLEDINLDLPSQKIEIGGIGWFSYEEARNMIRPYHINRLRILDEIVLFLAHNLKYYASYNKSILE